MTIFTRIMTALFFLGVLIVFSAVGASDANIITPARELVQAVIGFALIFVAGHFAGFFRQSSQGGDDQ